VRKTVRQTDCLKTPAYLSFLHFEKANSVAEKLQIFLCPLAGNLRSNELFVERVVIVLLVWRQVHLVVLDVLTLAIVRGAHVVTHFIVGILVILWWHLAMITVKV